MIDRGGEAFPVGRLAFKAREGRQTALSGFDSHSLPPRSRPSSARASIPISFQSETTFGISSRSGSSTSNRSTDSTPLTCSSLLPGRNWARTDCFARAACREKAGLPRAPFGKSSRPRSRPPAWHTIRRARLSPVPHGRGDQCVEPESRPCPSAHYVRELWAYRESPAGGDHAYDRRCDSGCSLPSGRPGAARQATAPWIAIAGPRGHGNPELDRTGPFDR
jgi:hypothetical protein